MDKPLVLTILVPQPVTVIYGRYRNRFSTQESLQPLITSCRALRRVIWNGVMSESEIEVEAFIPEHMRRSICGARSSWIDDEWRRSVAAIADNRKSLAAFIESGDREWKFEEKS
jgi:hypothetical protein